MNFGTQIINGLALGAGYALLAVGWTILLGAARLVNFAHGQFYMLGAFITWYAMSSFGVPYLLAIPIAVVVVAVLGGILELLLNRMALEQNIVSLMVTTLAFGYVFEGAAALIFGGDPQLIGSPFDDKSLNIGDARFTQQDLLIVIVTIIVYAATFFVLVRTNTGRIIRGVAEDPALARLYGINPSKVYFGVFVFASAAVAIAGGVMGPRSPILTSMGFQEVIITFLVVVLGGVGRVFGALIAGLSLGLFVALWGVFLPPAYSTAAAFAVLLVLLSVRPQGVKAL